jgi:peptide/nickel transport system permease protein
MAEPHEAPQPISPVGERGGQPARLAAWLQFPRRLVLLLLAWALSSVIIKTLVSSLVAAPSLSRGTIDWTLSLAEKRAVADIVAERLPNTLLLVGVALGLALILALALAVVAAGVHRLESRAGPLGSVLKGLGRLLTFAPAALPAWGLAVVFLYLLVFQLRLLPAVGLVSSSGPGAGGFVDRVRHLVLPAAALAAFPAVATAQSIAREVTLLRTQGGLRLWLTGLLRGLGTLLGQAGGILGAAVVVEIGFAWPGLGRTLVESLLRSDLPVVLGVLLACAVFILVGRIAAELFRWLERLVREEPVPGGAFPRQQRAHRVYVVVALALLLVPLGLAAVGAFSDVNAVLRTDTASINQGPSASHPLGTDTLGRDIMARVFRGVLVSLAAAVIAALAATFVGGAYGALAGFVASRRTLLAESLADVLLWPADVMLFMPAVAVALIVAQMLNTPLSRGADVNWLPVLCALAIALLPRVFRAAQTLWLGRAEEHKGALLDGVGAVFLSAILLGLGLVVTLDHVGLGIQPPTPTLGGLIREGTNFLRLTPLALLAPGIALWACATALYFAADALIGYFQDKGVLARLNE